MGLTLPTMTKVVTDSRTFVLSRLRLGRYRVAPLRESRIETWRGNVEYSVGSPESMSSNEDTAERAQPQSPVSISANEDTAEQAQRQSPVSEEEVSSADKSASETSSQPAQENVAAEVAATSTAPAADIRVRKQRCNWAAVCWESAIFLFAFLLGSVVITTFVWAAMPDAPSLLLALWSPTARASVARGEATVAHYGDTPVDVAVPWGPCASAACLEQSRLLLRQLNGTVDPCNDFYEHVCRNWAQAHPLQQGQEGVSMDDIMKETYANTLVTAISDERMGLDNLRRLFNECLAPSERLYYELMALFQKSLGLSGWNTTSGSKMDAAQLSRVLGNLQRDLGIDVVFRLTRVEAASGNGTLLVIQQPRTVLVRSKQSIQEGHSARQHFEPLLTYFRRSFKTDVYILEQRLALFFRRRDDDNLDRCPVLQVSQLPVMQRIEWLPLLRASFGDEDIDRISAFNNDLRGSLVTGLDAISWEPLFPAMLLNDSIRSATTASTRMHQWLTNSSRRWLPWLWRGGFLSSNPRLPYPYRRLEIPPATFSLNVYNDTATGALQIARIGPRIYGRLFNVLHSWTVAYDQGRRHQRKFVRSFATTRSCLTRDYDRMSWLRKTSSPGNGSWPLQDLWDGLAVPLAYEAFQFYLRKTGITLSMGANKVDVLNAPRLFFVHYAASLCENISPRLARWNTANGLRSPAWFRVNGPLRNMPQFANAFGCRPKAFMNPTRKCLLTGLN
ncbi:hypothetical protein HPB48_001349 [Haemaphysalis longicornis]|uniref:Uncharacterized protein n=1 Tax=Haemaphysalis longicornis TaxID=44386 RepID=A0A9J6FF19_HAELO|nr:hypothetical protein HPB48_001349 [Haemaphysalis longicornis]